MSQKDLRTSGGSWPQSHGDPAASDSGIRGLRLALESGAVGVWELDFRTGAVKRNAECALMLGFRPETVDSDPESWEKLVHPKDLPAIRSAWDLHTTGAATDYETEYRVRNASGGWSWILDRGRMVEWDADGQPLRATGTHLDISDRKAAEESLQRRDAILQAIALCSRRLLASSDWEPAIREVAERLGLAIDVDSVRLQECMGDATGSLYCRARACWERVNTGRAEEEDRPSRCEMTPDSQGRTGSACGTEPTWRQISGVEELHRRLEDGETFQGPVQVFPESAAAVLAREGDRSLLIIPVVTNQRLWGILSFADAGRRDHWPEHEIEALRTVAGILGAAIQRSRQDEEIGRANEELEKTTLQSKQMAAEAVLHSSAKSSFLASMSHEIRTPMNGILGMIDLLADTDLTEDQRELITMAYQSGEALLEIINEILDFSRIESGGLELESIDFNLLQVVEDAVELLAGKADGKGLELLSDVAENVPAVLRGDPVRLRQVLVNLLGNAVKFTERGYIRVKASLLESNAQDARLRIAVQDTGIGIFLQAQARLFRPYSQAEKNTTRRYGGTGLGLSISRQIVEAMGGQIGIDSQVDQGSTFWFEVRLPLSSASAESAPDRDGTSAGASASAGPEDTSRVAPGGGKGESEAQPAPSLAGRRVLVVEDQEATREFLCRRLGEWGLRASAGPGQEVLRELDDARKVENGIEAVLMDAGTVHSDSFGLIREIRRRPEFDSISIVVMMSLGHRRRRKEAEEAGASLFLRKPIRRALLRSVLHAAMEGAGCAGRAWPAGRAGHDGGSPEHAPPEIAGRRLKLDDPKPVPRAAPRAHLLIAEDNPVNQKVLSRMLEALGYSFEIATNGQQVLSLVRVRRFDLILMDNQMPVMDGFTASRRIRSGHLEDSGGEGCSQDVPIIAVTANVGEEERKRCLNSGMSDYLSKPVSRGALAGILEKWLAAHRPETPPLKPEEGEGLAA